MIKKIFLIILAFSINESVFAAPQIPSNISSYVRPEIEKLYSNDSKEKEKAADKLTELFILQDKNVLPSAPFLIDYAIERLEEGSSAARSKGSMILALLQIRGVNMDDNAAQRATAPLIIALKDGNENTRMHAAKALGGTKDYRAIEPLISALDDWLGNVGMNAADSLYKITGENFGENKDKWLEWWKQRGIKTFMGRVLEKKDTSIYKEKLILPTFIEELKGANEVRVKNPNDFNVLVGLRYSSRGRDFEVPANGVSSVFVPNGKYQIYFVYSNKPDALFQGDDFSLNDNGVEIQIVKVVGGNYGIRQVK